MRTGDLIDSIGIDTWGVDFVLLDKRGQRVGLPVSYRDSRTHGLMAQAIEQLGRANIYCRSGIQFLPFNTLYQLRALVSQQPALAEPGRPCAADPRLLQLPPDRRDELGIHQRHHHATGQYQ